MAPIRSLMVFDTALDVDAFARSCREWGVGTPCVHPGHLEDDRMLQALDHQGLRAWLNVPIFCDPTYLARHEEAYAITSTGRRAAREWLHFVCPSHDEHLDALGRRLGEHLSRSPPAVVSLDFIRHFVFWEKIPLDGSGSDIEDGCYCPTCLSRFERVSGEPIDRTDAPAYLHRHLLAAWSEWKCARILEVAEQLYGEIRARAPGARIVVNTLPWRATDLDGAILSRAGQDVPRLAQHADGVAPMAFTQMLGQTALWKERLLAHVRASTGKPVCFYVQVDAEHRAGDISVEQFDAELALAHACEPAAIVVLDYERLAASPEKAAVLRRHFRP